jgi:hypothetical protein
MAGCCDPHVNGVVGTDTPSNIKVFQEDSTDSLTTTSSTYVTLRTTSAQAKILNGETWKINWCVGVCHPQGVTGQNTQVQIQVETSSGVFAEFDVWQVNWGITISSGISCPAHRSKSLVASMDTPRFRFRVRWTVFTGVNTLVETPRVGGVIIPA